TNVGAEAYGDGYAAQFDTTSEMFVAQAAQVTHVEAVEVWFRIDAEPDDGERFGLYDSNVGPDNLSLFINRTGETYTLRCGLGGETTTWPATIAAATWYYAACLCTGTNQQMWLNGVLVGDTPGPCTNGGAIVADGLTIGANNNGGPTNIDAQFVGVIDGIRLTTVAPSPAQICERAGLPRC
ncbi:MAG: LamG-like jellyroll fold domain-containing protein, partial [Kofleriaceae bacterium]